MSAHACCSVVPAGGSKAAAGEVRDQRTRNGLARAGKVGSWLGPSALLVLLPKCPMCLAAYLALAGIGVSVELAAWLRTSLMLACVMTIGILLMRSFAAPGR